VTLTGDLLSPQFMTYEAGATFFYSRLTGSEIKLNDRELNYYLLSTLFPGRRLSLNFLARRYTDQLQDNLLLFNRNRFSELGGELLLREGARMPSLGLRYFRRYRDTFYDQPYLTLYLCNGSAIGACTSLVPVKTFTKRVALSESNTEGNFFLDKRNKDLQYHLGLSRATFDSSDFGYSTTSDTLNFDATKWLMSRRLQAIARGSVYRTETDTKANALVDVGAGDVGLLSSRTVKTTETDLGVEFRYRGTRFDHDAAYDWTRTAAGGFTETQQEGNLGTTYRISDKTTLNANYVNVLVNGLGNNSRNQTLQMRLTRRTTPNLVFYVQGRGQTIRNSNSGAEQFSSPTVSFCGNGILEAGEQCDDGNTINGDGCSSTCRKEPTLPVSVCGNGIREPDEQCDDGNTNNGDGCSSTCRTELIHCGNGHLDPGEQCDDGNKTSGDGCSSTCQREPLRPLGPQDVTLIDFDVGGDYTRRVRNFTAYSSLLLGAGHGSVSPGGSGSRTRVEARLGVAGTVFPRINVAGSVSFHDSTDASGYEPDLKQTMAQVTATRVVGRHLQLRARAFATNINQDRSKVFANLGLPLEAQLILDEKQRNAEIGFVTFLPRGTYVTFAVGRQSVVTNLGNGDVENRFNYLNASLTLHPVSHLELVGSARIQRGFQLTNIQDDRDYIDLQAVYLLRDWRFELGYTTNHDILSTTDYEQRRIFLTVRREFGWRLR
jgi:cysteine-rich repeat protein